MLKPQATAAASATITSSVVRMTTVLARSLGILVSSSCWNGHTKAMANMENATGAKTDRAKYKAAAARMVAHKLGMVRPVADLLADARDRQLSQLSGASRCLQHRR